MSDFLKELQKHLRAEPDKIPPGWRTLDQMVKETGRPKGTVRSWIQTLDAKGRIERKRIYLLDVSGRRTPHSIYKLKS